VSVVKVTDAVGMSEQAGCNWQ